MNEFFNDPFTSFKEIFILHAIQIILIYDIIWHLWYLWHLWQCHETDNLWAMSCSNFIFRCAYYMKFGQDQINVPIHAIVIQFSTQRTYKSAFLQSWKLHNLERYITLEIIVIDVNKCKNCIHYIIQNCKYFSAFQTMIYVPFLLWCIPDNSAMIQRWM